MKSSFDYGRNQPLVDAIELALTAWREAVRAEVESDYSDAMLSVERANAEGFYTGLRVAFVTLNGHEPELNCPNHEGGFDCTPFCELCGGEQVIADEVPICMSCEGKGYKGDDDCGNCEGRGTLE